MDKADQAQLSLKKVSDGIVITCSGYWNWKCIPNNLIEDFVYLQPEQAECTLDASRIQEMDTAGAYFFDLLCQKIEGATATLKIQGLDNASTSLINLMKARNVKTITPSERPEGSMEMLGRYTLRQCKDVMHLFAFIGEIFIRLSHIIKKPSKFAWRDMYEVMGSAGYYALPIIGLLAFLVGVTISYQVGNQLTKYGANLYIVDLLGYSMLREFGPLVTAIIASGRSGAAFASEIGTMKAREELDALLTMGISPISRVVLPRLLALLIVIPLLTVWADIFSIFGGMVMTAIHMEISLADFLTRFNAVVSLDSYLIGLVKAPVFALIIAAVGCYRGMSVTADSASIGQETTAAVVQSIFFIILVDAIFSIFFSMMGI